MPRVPSAEMGTAQIREALSPFGVSISDNQADQIRLYTSTLVQWNRSIALTTVSEPMEIVRRHFGESMFAARFLPVEKCRLADVGSGAGFPGMALKIARPDLSLVLIESNHKKCAFLSEIVRALKLEDVQVLRERFERIRTGDLSLNIVTSRAVGEFKELLRWSRDALSRSGQIILWVGAEDSTRLARDGHWIWQPTVHLPESQRRYILIGRPLREQT